jgi:hypothetical protein
MDVKKRGRPRKRVLTPKVDSKATVEEYIPVAELVPDNEKQPDVKFDKRPPLDRDVIKVVVSIAPDGRRNIDCGGLSIIDTYQVLSTAVRFMANDVKKELELNEAVVEEGTADAPSGSNP